MSELRFSRVVFHSVHDRAGFEHLTNGERILRSPVKSSYSDINDVLELYNIIKYLDHGLVLPSWSSDEVLVFQKVATIYKSVVGRYMSTVTSENLNSIFASVASGYCSSFWELFNDQGVSKKVSADAFAIVLSVNPYLIRKLLTHSNIVTRYNSVLRDFLLGYSESIEILLSVYELRSSFTEQAMMLPQSLTIEDKELIVERYLSSSNVKPAYLNFISTMSNNKDFRISDQVRLRAQRLYSSTETMMYRNGAFQLQKLSVSFQDDVSKIKDFCFEGGDISYIYSSTYIRDNNHPYNLFMNFKHLFEYLDDCYRIALVSNEKDLCTFERLRLTAKKAYGGGSAFIMSENSSYIKILSYSNFIEKIGISLEDIIQQLFERIFQEKYDFAHNAKFAVSTAETFLEKIRFLAPEFESALKQFNLFVADRCIDFELLQISSSPLNIQDIKSLNSNKYVYLNEEHNLLNNCLHLFFSDQTTLSYVEPFKEDNYKNFFDLVSTQEVKYSNYGSHQKRDLDYLIDEGFLEVDSKGLLKMNRVERLFILQDLHDNEVGSFYHYPPVYQKEAIQMAVEGIVRLESTLFSKPEQAYFNYYLNKKYFTNGLDLRNSYVHGTQAGHEDISKHKFSYFSYLKLIFLALLKIDDDLYTYKNKSKIETS